MVKKITFHIGSDGEVTLSVDGVQGSSCEALSAPFEASLGKVAQRDYKDSFYQEADAQNELGQGGDSHG